MAANSFWKRDKKFRQWLNDTCSLFLYVIEISTNERSGVRFRASVCVVRRGEVWTAIFDNPGEAKTAAVSAAISYLSSSITRLKIELD